MIAQSAAQDRAEAHAGRRLWWLAYAVLRLAVVAVVWGVALALAAEGTSRVLGIIAAFVLSVIATLVSSRFQVRSRWHMIGGVSPADRRTHLISALFDVALCVTTSILLVKTLATPGTQIFPNAAMAHSSALVLLFCTAASLVDVRREVWHSRGGLGVLLVEAAVRICGVIGSWMVADSVVPAAWRFSQILACVTGVAVWLVATWLTVRAIERIVSI